MFSWCVRFNGLPGLILGALAFILILYPSRVQCKDDFASRMLDITEDMDEQLKEIMTSQVVTYSTINKTGLPYNATTKFNPKGMGQLYNVTNMFIDFVQSRQAYPEGMITLENGQPKLADPVKEWKIIITHYGGLAGLALAGLLLAAILPCVGLFFCCCRCAGHCGARSQPFDKKHDHCRKIMLSVVLIGVATIILFGVVCAFVTNEYMQDGTENLSDNVEISLKDVNLYLTTTKRELDSLLINNFNELEITLNNILQSSGKIVAEQLAKYSHAVSLTHLNDLVEHLQDICLDLKTMNNITQELRTNATQLDIDVRSVKKDLLYTLSACSTHYCKQVLQEYKVNHMSVEVDFDKLPDVTVALRKITSLMDSNIVSEVSQGRDSFLKIQEDIQHAVNQTIPVVSASIRRTGDSLAKTANNLTAILDGISDNINKIYIPHLRMAGDQIKQYSPYRYYLGLGISSILLTVLMCLTFGLLCGICGKRPDGYGDDCCNKGSGARFLMMAVWIIFLLTSILMIVTVAHMMTGVVVQRGICEPLKNPNDNRMFQLVDDFVEIKDKLYPKIPEAEINMSYIVTMCHANETLYKVLRLDYLINLDNLHVGRYDMMETIQHLQHKINLSPGVVILSSSAISKLKDLAESGLSDIKFYQYAEHLQNNITNINLRLLANKLMEVSAKVPASQANIRDSLIKNAADLERIHKELVVPMTTLSGKLIDIALVLEEHIKFNHSSMATAIDVLVDEVIRAQSFLNVDGPKYVQLLATRFGQIFLQQVENFLDLLTANAIKSVGKCAPVSNAYNATLVAGCNRILDPFNGFWASVGWCLVLFIPTIILCVKLSALYQKSDPYPGPLVEAEYLYDAYADRDNIPLAHVHDKKSVAYSRHHPSAYVESYDGPASGCAERERISEAHQGTSDHESRYADLAPKNWDFANLGPPRYQPPTVSPLSTEYERPPPYYYPGPGDRN
ncbi:prominin-like protein isoform X3 [Cephus cinctus]|uniref:Prominin-like protein isoform X3 n=1 Tax=Cephus cinctus TaxID=211228 RepID=A0AAJ7FJV2_CEPCN|nr:prominin-like protein isoform X3 [Cephus cinctus]